MITELKDFYHRKHSIFHAGKDIAVRINLLVQQFCSDLTSHTQMIHASIQSLPTIGANNKTKYMYDFAAHLQSSALSAATNLTNVSELKNTLRHCPDTPISLEGYKEIPTLLKVISLNSHRSALPLLLYQTYIIC